MQHNHIIRLRPLSGNEDQICGIISRHAAGSSSEAQYQRLREQTDPNSEFERVVLAAIYQQELKLPDAAQELIPEANSKPDFIYKAAPSENLSKVGQPFHLDPSRLSESTALH